MDHAKNIQSTLKIIQKKPLAHPATPLIMESDGGMVPMVKTDDETLGDKRKTRKTYWMENKLSLAYFYGEVDPKYASCIGDVDEAGRQFSYLADLSGRDKKTKIHFLGDGAPWIADQVENQFGSQAYFLLDFYHLSEYIHKAALCLDPDGKNDWANVQKKRLKSGEIVLVLNELKNHIDQEHGDDHICEADVCYNYMINRSYAAAGKY